MDFEFTIRFGKPNIPDYLEALGLATKFRMFKPANTDTNINVVETSNHEVMFRYEAFQKLMEIIKDWESAKVIHGQKELSPAEFSLAEKQVIAKCYLGYMNDENKEDYCDPKTPACWGCKQLSGIILRHTKSPYHEYTRYWYQYGQFIDKCTWRINKEALTRALEEIVAKKSIDFCPMFDLIFFRRYVAALPTLVHMSDTRNWGFVYSEDSTNKAKRWEAKNVQHIIPSTEREGVDKDIGDDGLPGKHKKTNKESLAQNLRYVPETSFADIGGVDELIQSIRIVIELPILKPKLFEHLGVKPYRGILLWGDPGNGKTLIAKAIAHEVNAHFSPVSGPDILNKNFGQSEKNLRDIFEEAREFQPSVIFIDEIDSIAQTRLSGESAKWYATVVNQLMSLMDGINDYGNITVLASTNRPDLLDAALLRPGRFDYKLEIKKPNLPGCKRVLEIATRDMPLDDDIDLFAFSESVIGYSAAEITFLAKEAAMVALRKAIETKAISLDDTGETDYSFIKISMSDFNSALHLLKWHRRYVNLSYSLKDKKLT